MSGAFNTYMFSFPILLLDGILQVVCSNMHGFLGTGDTHMEEHVPLHDQFAAGMKTTTEHTLQARVGRTT